MKRPVKTQMDDLYGRLETFAKEFDISSRGPLSVMLVITRRAMAKKEPPYRDTDFLTKQGGQVAGLGRAAVQAILADHGIERILAEEGGRTSRGSIRRMRAYVNLLNELNKEGILDFAKTEAWWVERVRNYFAAQPLRLRIDQSKSLRRIIGELIESAFARQEECPGTTVAGTVIEHLVGAKLQIALPDANIEDRVDILEIEQFVATNVYEWSRFNQHKRPPTVAELVETYNKIIDQCETDPSLKISIG